MDLQAYMLQVAQRGRMLDQSNPSTAVPVALGTLMGLGTDYAVTDVVPLVGTLGAIASKFHVQLDPVPALGPQQRTEVMYSRLADWSQKALAAVQRVEQAAGVDPRTIPASELISADETVAKEIESKGNTILGTTSSVLPSAVNISGRDLALAMRRQYNSAVAGMPLLTPMGIQKLIESGAATEQEIGRDYFERMAAFQALAKIGNSDVATTMASLSGLGFLQLIPVVILAVVAVALIMWITAAFVVSRNASQRNAIWEKVLSECAKKDKSNDFCSQAVKGFSEDSLLGSATGLRFGDFGPWLLALGGALAVLTFVPKRNP